MSRGALREANADVLLVLVFIAIVNVAVYQITWVYAGPITASATVVLASLLLRRRGIKWRDLGLRRPKSIRRTLWQALVILIGTGLVVYLSYLLVGQHLEKPVTMESRFGDMEGNLLLYLWWVLLGWAAGGFLEEMLFRGYLLNRVEAALGRGRLATAGAIVFQAGVFAAVHYYYQGAYGALQIFPAAAFIGACYLLFGRNLWPLILAHGTMNTLGFLGDYLGD